MTALAHKYWPVILAALLCALLLVAWFTPRQDRLTLGTKTYRFELADTNQERQQGLSGRAGLPHNKVMFFDFGTIEPQCMWMKDMRFAIDMVWLSPEYRVQHIEENVAPETYPKSFCSPKSDSAYVVELAAGQVQANGVKVGDHAQF